MDKIIDSEIKNSVTIKLHIGCGKNHLDGWINCDIRDDADVYWDLLSDNLPFKADSIDYIFSEHVLEHFRLHDAINILKKLHQILKPDGKIRIVVPSLESLITGYLNDPEFLDTNNKLFPEKKLAFNAQLINQTFYNFGHKNMYDKQLLIFAMRSAGFNQNKLSFLEDGVVKSDMFKNIGRRIYKETSSVHNLNVEATKL